MKKNKIIIGKQFEFESAHSLPKEEIYGVCSQLHGHTYKLTIEIEGNLNDEGWVINFKKLKEIVNEKVIKLYDHHNLNNYFKIPTAENIILEIWNNLGKEFKKLNCELYSVTLFETSNSYAKIVKN